MLCVLPTGERSIDRLRLSVPVAACGVPQPSAAAIRATSIETPVAVDASLSTSVRSADCRASLRAARDVGGGVRID